MVRHRESRITLTTKKTIINTERAGKLSSLEIEARSGALRTCCCFHLCFSLKLSVAAVPLFVVCVLQVARPPPLLYSGLPPPSLSLSLPIRSSTTGFQSACRAPPFILPICFLRVLRILFSSSLTAHIPRSLILSLSVRLSPFTASVEERERECVGPSLQQGVCGTLLTLPSPVYSARTSSPFQTSSCFFTLLCRVSFRFRGFRVFLSCASPCLSIIPTTLGVSVRPPTHPHTLPPLPLLNP